ncbi:uncharacterized protein LOC132551757 [Ylistrum balloti]|uniref:uncharacterized protein LOC132551757 n=1 Tax=Ylistrum balloti TaxID=509963 RepID=UPI002905DA1B|nr:uncharacterized protein LOC132551757 [Ylistrum balloti]
MAALRKCFVFLTKTSQTGKHFMCLSGKRLSVQPSAAHTTWSRKRMVTVTTSRKLSLFEVPAGSSGLPKTFTHDSRRKGGDDTTPEKLSDSSLNCRLAAENGFLSWARNAYISCVAGCALLSHAQTEPMVDAVFGIFFISCMNMACGTVVYISNLLSMQRRVQMSSRHVLLSITLTLIHAVIYASAMFIFLEDFDSKKIKGLEDDEEHDINQL